MNGDIFKNIIVLASQIFVIATGFALIFRTVRFFHFAHGIVFTIGAYFVFLFCRMVRMQFVISIVLALLACMLLGCLMEFFIYRPLRKRESKELVLLLASLGVYIVLQNIISMIFGDETRSIRTGISHEGLSFIGTTVMPIQIVIVCVGLALVVILPLFFRKTKIGKAIRAVANDPMLANVSGINSKMVTLWAFSIGSGLAGLAGVLIALDIDMTPTMGMNALMMAVVAVIIGGVDSIPGIALGALLLGMAQQFGTWYIGSQWQDAIVFLILIIFLLFKPEGFFGKKIKSATV